MVARKVHVWVDVFIVVVLLGRVDPLREEDRRQKRLKGEWDQIQIFLGSVDYTYWGGELRKKDIQVAFSQKDTTVCNLTHTAEKLVPQQPSQNMVKQSHLVHEDPLPRGAADYTVATFLG